jgi:hypothetical protein
VTIAQLHCRAFRETNYEYGVQIHTKAENFTWSATSELHTSCCTPFCT